MGSGNDLSTNRSSPVVDFTSSDFDAFKTDLTSYAQAKFAGNGWTDFNETQPAVIFLDLECYLSDLLTYQLNSHIRELFAGTVIRRQNLVNIGKPFSYVPQGASAATVVETLTLDPAGIYPLTILRATVQVSNEADGDAQVLFTPTTDTIVSTYPVGGKVDVSFTQGEFYQNYLIGVSANAPGQRWQFPQQDVLRDSITLTVGGVSWSSVANWTGVLSTSTVFKILQTDDGNTYAVFGDGVQGAIPATSAEIRASFRVGGGRQGNLSPGAITKKVAVPAQVLAVTNNARSSGGDVAPSMKQAREGIPATISTLQRAVTIQDHELLSEQVSGVAKARASAGTPAGSNRVNVIIAPSGGGDPTPALKSSVSTYLKPRKMVGRRIALGGPAYRNLRFQVLLHINENYRASDVLQATTLGITNTGGTGVLDFAQLDFEAVSLTADGNEELLLGQTRLQAYFDGLRSSGLERAEIQQLDIEPVARARAAGNSGNGVVTNVTVNSRQRRREYSIEVTSSATYRVYERIVGTVGSMTDTSITDDNKDFGYEGVASYAGWVLNPDRNGGSLLPVISASAQTLSVLTAGQSLFTSTDIGTNYYLYNPIVTDIAVGTPFTSSDGNVSFTLVAGSNPFINGDIFTLDVFPQISDIRLKADEYPSLSVFTVRTSGGSKI